jgi:NTP pyrophosphatase (non-canonical NTP hydrolase)
MTDLQKNVIKWAIDKGLNDPVKQTLKTLSEAGELADAICKEDEELRSWRACGCYL